MVRNTMTNLSIVTDANVKECGRVVYWEASGEADVSQIARMLEEAGLNDLAPSRESPGVVCRRVLAASAKGLFGADERTLVRSTGGDGLALVVERRSEDDVLAYVVMIVADVVDGVYTFRTVVEDDRALEVADRAKMMQASELSMLSAQATSRWLSAVMPALSSVLLRSHGGVHFVPRESIGVLEELVAVVHKASDSRVYRIPAVSSAETVGAVTDALASEVAEAVGSIEAELDSDEGLTRRQCATRTKRLDEVSRKIGDYEELLATSLSRIRDKCSALRAEMSVLMLSGGEDDGE